MKTGDITDAFLRALRHGAGAPLPGAGAPFPGAGAAPQPPAETPARAPARTEKGRPFLTDYHVRRALTPGSRDLTIAKDAIVSPLALEWLALKGVRIVRSS